MSKSTSRVKGQSANIRRIDHLGRVVIPSHIRKQLDIKRKDTVEVYLESERIYIQKEKDHNECLITKVSSPDNFDFYGLTLSKEGAAMLLSKLEKLSVGEDDADF